MNVLKILLIILAVLALLITALFLFMIKPNRKRKETQYFKGKMYAHRGLHDEVVPENSLTAFRLAREQGYGVELDVQMTRDGQLVVFHDGSLNRVCGIDGKLKDYTFEELEQFRLKGTEERIPLFSEVLKTLGNVDLICEIKSDNGIQNYELCQKTYEALMTYGGRFCMESFSPYLVAWFKKNHPEIVRGQLSENFIKSTGGTVVNFCMTHLLVNVLSRPDFVAYNHYHAETSFGFKVCRKLYHPLLVAWTAKGPEEQESAWKTFESVIFEKNKPKE